MPYPDLVKASINYGAANSVVCPTDANPGDALFLIFINNSATAPAGWSLIYDGAYVDVWMKVADGSDPGSTITLSGLVYGLAISVVRNCDPTLYGAINASGFGQDTPNCPSLTMGASDDYLWLAYGYGSTSSYFTSPTAPSGYTMAASTNGVALAWRQRTAITEDPSAFGDGDASTTNVYMLTMAVPYKAPAGSPLFFGSNF